MTKEELRYWFFNILNSCYPVGDSVLYNHIIDDKDKDNYIYWMYDEKFIRKFKLSRINKNNVKLPLEISNNCKFIIDMNENIFYININDIATDYNLNRENIKRDLLDIVKNDESFNRYNKYFSNIDKLDLFYDVNNIIFGIVKFKSFKYNYISEKWLNDLNFFVK